MTGLRTGRASERRRKRCGNGYSCQDIHWFNCPTGQLCAPTEPSCGFTGCRYADPMTCGEGTFCDDSAGWLVCRSYMRCANADFKCAAGFHCEDQRSLCMPGRVCAPTTPSCVKDVPASWY